MKLRCGFVAGALSGLLLGGPAQGATAERPILAATQQARAYRVAHEREIVAQFAALLAIPNNARDTMHIRENAQKIVALLQARGVNATTLEVPEAPPVVYGELRVPGAHRTVTVYAHYDGQPVDARQWHSDPYTPVLRDRKVEEGGQALDLATLPAHLDPQWRLYARSAGDDKAPIIGFLAALDALHAAGIKPSLNLKFFLEGEEEVSSPHLRTFLARYADRLRTDLWLLCDGPVHQSGQGLVFFGVRGHAHLDITVYGPNHGLHSGSYGNWAPNPISQLTTLLAGMRDDEAHILIPGFYDEVRPVTAAERHAIDAMPDQERALKAALGFARSEGEPLRLEARMLEPALNVVGILGGHVGADSANVISSQANAAIDFRLVPDQTPEQIEARVEAYIAAQGFFVLHSAPDRAAHLQHPKLALLSWDVGYPPYRTPMDSPAALALVQAVTVARGAPPIQVPALGGSVPMQLFADLNHAPVIGLPIANYDDNQHTADENLTLQNLWDGIELYATLFTELGHHLPPSAAQ